MTSSNSATNPKGLLHNQVTGTVLDGMQAGDSPLEFITSNIKAKKIDDSSTVLVREEQEQPGEFSSLVDSAIASVRKTHGLENESGQTKAGTENSKPVEAFSFEPIEEERSGEGEEGKGDQGSSTESEQPNNHPGEEAEGSIEATEDEQALAAEAQKNPKGPAASIINLRKQVKNATTQLTETKALLEARTAELEKYRTGEIVPERVTELQKRIDELEPFEQLHNFRLSSEYHERYTKPLQQLTAEARQLAKDYAVDERILDQALKLSNVRDLNVHLSKYFQDPVGAMQARDLVLKIRNLAADMQQAEKNPQEKLEALQKQARETEAAEVRAREEKFVNDVKMSWGNSVKKLTAAGQFPELTIREGDEEHNAIARPIITAAAQEFGKVMKILAQYGLRELPDKLMMNLAQRFALSQAAAVSGLSRDQHAARAKAVIENAKRTQPLLRPPIGGSTSGAHSNGNGAPAARQPMTPEKAADTLLEGVLNRKS